LPAAGGSPGRWVSRSRHSGTDDLETRPGTRGSGPRRR
jgi:hypothetical protein